MSTTGLVHGCCSVRSRLVVQFDGGVIRSSVGVVIVGLLAYTLSSFDSADADRKGDQFTSKESPSSSMGVIGREMSFAGMEDDWDRRTVSARGPGGGVGLEMSAESGDFMLLFGQRLADQGDAKQL